MAPVEVSAAKAERADAIETKPPPVGATPPLDQCPHALMVPEEASAAKALSVDAMETKPLPVGGLLHCESTLQSKKLLELLLPPLSLPPHTLMVPEEFSAANAAEFDVIDTKLPPVGAPLPP